MRSLFIRAWFAAALSGSLAAQVKPGLDTTTWVVMGEGLAAGMGNFGLSSPLQNFSFPAQAAAQMHTGMSQPLFEPPGIGNFIGTPTQEVRLHTYPQGSVRQFYSVPDSQVTSPPVFLTNLSVPQLTLTDSLSLRPAPPIAQRDMKQTTVNLILGFPQLFLDRVPLWTQFEYAQAMNPTMVLIELGYYEALDAAVNLDPARLPDPSVFGAQYATLVAGMATNHAQVIVATIPNPLDTAYFSSPATAASIVGANPSVIISDWQITAQDYVARAALSVISFQLLSASVAPLPAGSVLTASTAQDLTARINALNAQIVNVARAQRAVVWDLAGFLHQVKVGGVAAGSLTLTADYLGGFYTLDAVYPGPTGNALIANNLLSFLNATYGKGLPLIDTAKVAALDPVVLYQKPAGAPGHIIRRK